MIEIRERDVEEIKHFIDQKIKDLAREVTDMEQFYRYENPRYYELKKSISTLNQVKEKICRYL